VTRSPSRPQLSHVPVVMGGKGIGPFVSLIR
jgi:hypothetical protein